MSDGQVIEVTFQQGDVKAAEPKKKRGRRKNDAYFTVDDLARGMIARIASYVPEPKAVLEPTCGDGAFVKAIRAQWPNTRIGAVDLDGGVREKALAAGANLFVQSDILAVPRETLARFDLAIGNLPFKDSAKILVHLRSAGLRVWNLGPVSFVGWTQGKGKDGGLARDAAFWDLVKNDYLAALAPRPSFTNDGKTDRMEYGLFGFGFQREAGPRIYDHPIVWGKK